MMNSNMLKKQKDDFLKSVDDYNVKYKKIMEKIKQINVSFDNSSDTLLYKFMGENNIKIIEKINNLLKELETAKQASIQEVDVKIFQSILRCHGKLLPCGEKEQRSRRKCICPPSAGQHARSLSGKRDGVPLGAPRRGLGVVGLVNEILTDQVAGSVEIEFANAVVFHGGSFGRGMIYL